MNGFAQALKHVKQKTKPVWSAMSKWRQKLATSRQSMQMKFVFPLDHDLGQRFSLLNIFIRPLVIEF